MKQIIIVVIDTDGKAEFNPVVETSHGPYESLKHYFTDIDYAVEEIATITCLTAEQERRAIGAMQVLKGVCEAKS